MTRVTRTYRITRKRDALAIWSSVDGKEPQDGYLEQKKAIVSSDRWFGRRFMDVNGSERCATCERRKNFGQFSERPVQFPRRIPLSGTLKCRPIAREIQLAHCRCWLMVTFNIGVEQVAAYGRSVCCSNEPANSATISRT